MNFAYSLLFAAMIGICVMNGNSSLFPPQLINEQIQTGDLAAYLQEYVNFTFFFFFHFQKFLLIPTFRQHLPCRHAKEYLVLSLNDENPQSSEIVFYEFIFLFDSKLKNLRVINCFDVLQATTNLESRHIAAFFQELKRQLFSRVIVNDLGQFFVIHPTVFEANYKVNVLADTTNFSNQCNRTRVSIGLAFSISKKQFDELISDLKRFMET